MKLKYLVLPSVVLVGYLAYPTVNKVQTLWQQYQLQAAITEIKRQYPAPVILFGDHKCRFCQQAREFLQSQQVQYLDLDVSRTGRAEDKAAYHRLREKGVPVLLIGNTMISGFDAEKIMAALAAKPVSP
jgi:glutaredoxin